MRTALLCLTLTIAAGALLLPLLVDEAAQQERTCRDNLRNVGTALEMYSMDFAGRYPGASLSPRIISVGRLTPNYLRTLPTCPSGTPYRLTVLA